MVYIQSGINIHGIVWMYRYYIVEKLKIVEVSFSNCFYGTGNFCVY